jgi:hypothetical protein
METELVVEIGFDVSPPEAEVSTPLRSGHGSRRLNGGGEEA